MLDNLELRVAALGGKWVIVISVFLLFSLKAVLPIPVFPISCVCVISSMVFNTLLSLLINIAGFVLYSYIYWANCGKGIYLSQAYVKSEYRKQGILKMLLQELEKREKECNFITNLVGAENEVMMKSLDKLNFKSSDLITYYRKTKEDVNE